VVLTPQAGVVLAHPGHVGLEDLLQLGQPTAWRFEFNEPSSTVWQAYHAISYAAMRGAGELVGHAAQLLDLSDKVLLDS
jgi:hypothetical protein